MRRLSKLATLASATLLGAFLVSGCGAEASNNATQAPLPGTTTNVVESLAAFDKLQVSDGVEVVVNRGENQQVSVSGDQSAVAELAIASAEGTLSISWPQPREVEILRVDVTMPSLAQVNASNGARVQALSGFDAAAMTIRANAGASVDGLFNVAGAMDVAAEAGSRVALGGSATTLNADLVNGSQLLADQFATADATVSTIGGSSAVVNVSGTLNATATQGGSVRYVGTPTQLNPSTDESGQIGVFAG